MRKIIEKCPSCGFPDLVAKTLQCPQCRTEVRGDFIASRFCRLAEDSLEFLETFVRNRGNLKEMERESHVAYTTLRNRLNEIIEEMGFERNGDDHDETESKRRSILDRLYAGEISPDEAIEAIRAL